MRKFFTFLTDEDGFSAKDFLMVLFGTLFALMVLIAFGVAVWGTLNPVAIQVIQLLDNVVITIVTGVFGLQGIKEFRRDRTQRPLEPDASPYNEGGQEKQDSPPKLP